MTRSRIAFVLLFGVLLGCQAWRLIAVPHGMASTWTRSADVGEVSARGPGVSQDFLMGADGLTGIWLQPWTGRDEAEPGGTIVFSLADVTRGDPVPILRHAVAASEVVSSGRFRLDVPEIPASRGRRFLLRVRHVGGDEGPAVHWAYRRTPVLPHGAFHAGGEERWGSLVFETMSRRATLPYWKHEILHAWPAWARSWWTIGAVLLLFNAGVAWACGVATGVSGAPHTLETSGDPSARVKPVLAHTKGEAHREMAGAPAGAPAAAPTGDSGAATGAARRAALLAAVAVVLAGNVVALWPTPAGRSITLIDQLADATIESSWPSIRQGIAVQLVTIHAPVFRAMVALPVSRVAWTVDVPRGAFLRGGAAMRADVWRAPSDGANLSVYVEAATGRTLVAQYTLAPYLYEHHRNLFPLEVPLEPWAGQAVTLAFETDPERWGNFVNDVPVWVEPRIEWPRGTAWGEARVHAR